MGSVYIEHVTQENLNMKPEMHLHPRTAGSKSCRRKAPTADVVGLPAPQRAGPKSLQDRKKRWSIIAAETLRAYGRVGFTLWTGTEKLL